MVVCYNAAVALLQYGDTLLFGHIIFGLGAGYLFGDRESANVTALKSK